MLLLEEKTERIIRCFYKVYNTLGYGFLEKVYENALVIELENHAFKCQKQAPLNVFYETHNVGLYFCDILVDDELIIELKAGPGGIILQHELQVVNYLKATRYEIGLILFFGEKATFKRKVLTNNMK